MGFTKYKHIIWDWNGTLLDDARLCVDILNKMLRRRKMETTTLSEYQKSFDFPVINYYLKLGFDFQKESFDDVAQEFIGDYELHRRKCQLRKGIIDVIKRFKAAGICQSVLSASQQSSLIEALEIFNLKHFFENIAGLDDYYARSKIDAGRNLFKNLAGEKTQILLVGDTTHDYEVANMLGADCLLLPSGHQSRERLLATGAKVCDSFNEALKMF